MLLAKLLQPSEQWLPSTRDSTKQPADGFLKYRSLSSSQPFHSFNHHKPMAHVAFSWTSYAGASHFYFSSNKSGYWGALDTYRTHNCRHMKPHKLDSDVPICLNIHHQQTGVHTSSRTRAVRKDHLALPGERTEPPHWLCFIPEPLHCKLTAWLFLFCSVPVQKSVQNIGSSTNLAQQTSRFKQGFCSTSWFPSAFFFPSCFNFLNVYDWISRISMQNFWF